MSRPIAPGFTVWIAAHIAFDTQLKKKKNSPTVTPHQIFAIGRCRANRRPPAGSARSRNAQLTCEVASNEEKTADEEHRPASVLSRSFSRLLALEGYSISFAIATSRAAHGYKKFHTPDAINASRENITFLPTPLFCRLGLHLLFVCVCLGGWLILEPPRAHIGTAGRQHSPLLRQNGSGGPNSLPMNAAHPVSSTST